MRIRTGKSRGWCLLAVLLLPAAAGGEVLVFRAGNEFVQTRGGWIERGDRLLFHDRSGRLYSVALREVDLPRSRELNARLAREGGAVLAGLVPAGPVAAERELAIADIPDALKHRGEALPEEREGPAARAAAVRDEETARGIAARPLPKLRRREPAPKPEPPSGKSRPGSRRLEPGERR